MTELKPGDVEVIKLTDEEGLVVLKTEAAKLWAQQKLVEFLNIVTNMNYE